MKIIEDDLLVRIFLSENTKHEGKPLYEFIISEARKMNIAGATVLRGLMGFGADKRLRALKLIDISDNLPLVIEIVDKEENLKPFFDFLDNVVKDGFITIEKVHVVKYR
ncbi:MAG: DUF190 domain-containing protein [Brevinematales bacterium]|nr:DUF190 domain-containing protein [Brevinematales bacterium]